MLTFLLIILIDSWTGGIDSYVAMYRTTGAYASKLGKFCHTYQQAIARRFRPTGISCLVVGFVNVVVLYATVFIIILCFKLKTFIYINNQHKCS